MFVDVDQLQVSITLDQYYRNTERIFQFKIIYVYLIPLFQLKAISLNIGYISKREITKLPNFDVK